MYRLLIADDEPTVRKGMLSCIDWEKFMIGAIREVKNGAEALEEAMIFKPDILLTDIRMPVMDGIELTYHIREKLPACQIVIMSGYDEFSYAKKLMKMKVTEYLLKPVDEIELMNAVARMIKEIEEGRQNGSRTADSQPDRGKHQGKRSIVRTALRYLEEHCSTDVRLSEVAEVAFVSPNYLSKIFKEDMDMSFIDYLNHLRVEQAVQLLLNTNLKTYEIAEKVGYNDYKYFSAMIKKHTGLSPREHRR